MGGVIHPLHQVDLLTPAERKITEKEYWAQRRGQEKLDELNQKMKEDGINTFLGNYDYYLEKTSESEPEEENFKTKTEIEKEKREEREERKKNKVLRKKKEKIEEEIATIEEKLSTIDSKLADSNTYSDYQLANDLSIERESLANTLDELYETWMELED